jgi:hypothetical protein
MKMDRDYPQLAFQIYHDTIEEKKKAFGVVPGELGYEFISRWYYAKIDPGPYEIPETIVALEELYGNRWIWFAGGTAGSTMEVLFKDEADFIQFKISYPCIKSSVPLSVQDSSHC